METRIPAICLVLLTMNIPFTAVAESFPEKPCGGHLKDPTGLVSNKFYEPPNNWCTWVIEASPSSCVELHINYVKMGNPPECHFGAIIIYDGVGENAKELGRICKYTDEVFYSSSDRMTITYFSDDLNYGDSFEAQYKTRVCN